MLLRIAGMVSALLVAGGLFVLPRGKDAVFRNHAVDREASASYFDLLTFSWSKTLFDPKRLLSCGVADLPVLDKPWRADHLAREHANSMKESRYSYKVVLAKSHAWSLVAFNMLTVLKAAAPLAPQAARFLLLRRLEDAASGTDLYGISLALSLGLLSTCEIWIDAYVPWYSTSRVQLPIQATLMSLVYQKALRLRSNQTQRSTKSTSNKGAVANHIRSDRYFFYIIKPNF